MQVDKYTLTWQTYADHLRDILKELRSDESFADVTLVTDDKKQIKAHRNILSACSSVFKEILQINTNNNHPVIYLRGIQHPEIESILQFIYLGEAKFYEERTKEFLSVVKNLEINMLSKGVESKDSRSEDTSDEETSEESAENFNENIENHEAGEQIDIVESNDSAQQSVIDQKMLSKLTSTLYHCKQCDKSYTGRGALRRHNKSAHEGLKFECKKCDYKAPQKIHLTKHIQSIHEGVKYACNQCDYQAKHQSGLTVHIQFVHKGVKYVCNQCDQHFTQQSNLTTHMQSVHEGVKYACNQCDKQFTQLNSLTIHIQSLHEGVKYACNECNYEGSRPALRLHMKSKHH